MLIDKYLPLYDVTQVVQVEVDAPAGITYAAIRDTDLRDPVIAALFTLREMPLRLLRRWRCEVPPPSNGPVTFGSITTEGPGWTVLEESPANELVVGSIGKFWKKDYGGRPVTAAEYQAFNEPGFAKLAVSLAVRVSPAGNTILRYEARTATSDPETRKRFRRYWALIHVGVAIVMRRALRKIRNEAEQRAQARLVPAEV